MKRRSLPIDVREEGYWYVVPEPVHDFLRDNIEHLGAAGCWTYMVLKRYAGLYTRQAETNLESLCKDTNQSRSTVFKYLALLEELGLINKMTRLGGGYIFRILKVPAKSTKQLADLPLFSEEAAKTQSAQPDCPVRPAGLQSAQPDAESGQPDCNKEVRNVETPKPKLKPSADADMDVPEPPGLDSQHLVVREHIKAKYSAANHGLVCPWGSRTALELKKALEHLRWADADLLLAIDNRFASDVVLSDDPIHWISRLAMYQAGPLNQFNKPQNGNGKGLHATYTQFPNKAQQRQDATLLACERAKQIVRERERGQPQDEA